LSRLLNFIRNRQTIVGVWANPGDDSIRRTKGRIMKKKTCSTCEGSGWAFKDRKPPYPPCPDCTKKEVDKKS